MELEQQLGGLFSLLTVEFLEPYLNRTLHILQRNKEIPKIPKESVRPQIIAGVNALGRGQDEESLIRFAQTLSQTVGPEMMVKYLDPGEYVKRLAAAQGIDALNLIKSPETMAQEKQQMMQEQQMAELTKQAGQFAGTPMMDPSKHPAIGRAMDDGYDQLTGQNGNETIPPEEGAPQEAGPTEGE